jgi:hypothetical protein
MKIVRPSGKVSRKTRRRINHRIDNIGKPYIILLERYEQLLLQKFFQISCVPPTVAKLLNALCSNRSSTSLIRPTPGGFDNLRKDTYQNNLGLSSSGPNK